MKYYELSAVNQKSFYGKALVFEKNGNIYLKSYDTFVCGFENGNFKRFWAGYSATTQKHINAFMDMLAQPRLDKKDWLNIPAETFDYNKLYI